MTPGGAGGEVLSNGRGLRRRGTGAGLGRHLGDRLLGLCAVGLRLRHGVNGRAGFEVPGEGHGRRLRLGSGWADAMADVVSVRRRRGARRVDIGRQRNAGRRDRPEVAVIVEHRLLRAQLGEEGRVHAAVGAGADRDGGDALVGERLEVGVVPLLLLLHR